MKLNPIPNLRVEDFISQQTWIGRLFINLNPFFSSVNQVLDKNIDFTDNIKSVTRSYIQDIVTFQSFNFTWPYTSAPPIELRITKASKGSTMTPTILLAAWSYSATTGLILVSGMVEVSESGVSSLTGTYQFTVRVSV